LLLLELRLGGDSTFIQADSPLFFVLLRLSDFFSPVLQGSPLDTVDTLSPFFLSRSTSTCESSSESTRRRFRSSKLSGSSSHSFSVASINALADSSFSLLSPSSSKTGTVYICNGCEIHHTQNFGRVGENTQKNGKGINYTYKNSSGPPVGQKCDECGSTHHVSFDFSDL